jgi:hypothetical protein
MDGAAHRAGAGSGVSDQAAGGKGGPVAVPAPQSSEGETEGIGSENPGIARNCDRRTILFVIRFKSGPGRDGARLRGEAVAAPTAIQATRHPAIKAS